MNRALATYFRSGSHSGYSYIWSIATTLYCLIAVVACGCTDPAFLALIALNAALCSVMLFAPGARPFSLNKFINLFLLVFFVLAVGVQYASGSSVTSFAFTPDRSDYLALQGCTSAGIILCNAVYLLIYTSSSARMRRPSRRPMQKASGLMLTIVAGVATVAIFACCGFDLPTMFSRGAWQAYADSSWMAGKQEVVLLFQRVVRPIPACCLIIAMLGEVRGRYFALLLLLMLLTFFPTAMPRSMAATFWIPVVLIPAERYLSRNASTLLMILSILVAFPLLDSFRYSGEGREIEYGLGYFNSLNYDAAQMTMAAVKTDTITDGRQLLGSLAFFVPRKVWADKPEGSGHLIAGIHNAPYRNVSMPWFGEGYVNFGWIGAIIFTLVLALVAAKGDAYFRPQNVMARRSMLAEGCYLIILASSIFLLRGSFMASFSALVGNILSFALCCLCTVRRTDR